MRSIGSPRRVVRLADGEPHRLHHIKRTVEIKNSAVLYFFTQKGSNPKNDFKLGFSDEMKLN